MTKLRSRSFLIFVAVALMLLLLRSRLAVLLPQLPVNPRSRTTNTQILAMTFTPDYQRSQRGNDGFVSGDSLGILGLDVATSTPVPSFSAQGNDGLTAQSTEMELGGRVANPEMLQYRVKAGDTLYSIARHYGVTMDTLATLNGLTDVDQLHIGQILTIPVPTEPTNAPATAETTIYIVEAGDTLASISRKLNISITELQRLNNLADPNSLKIGQQLRLPASTSAEPQAQATVMLVDRSVDELLDQQAQPAENENTQAGPTATPTLAPRPTRAPVAPPPTPTPVPTPTPNLLLSPPYCSWGREETAVWGVHVCAPEGWAMDEEHQPNEAMIFRTTTETGEALLYAIIRPQAIPNAPLSEVMRSAKESVIQDLGRWITGGVAPPAQWSPVQSTTVSKQPAQSVSAETTYGMNGTPGTLRLIVFNNEGQRWHLVMIAPTAEWSRYANDFFATITRSLEVF